MTTIDKFMLLNSIRDEEVNEALNKMSSIGFYQQYIVIGSNDGNLFKLDNHILNEDDESSFVTSVIDKISVIEKQIIWKMEMLEVLSILAVLIGDALLFVYDVPLQIKSFNLRLKQVCCFSTLEGLLTNNEYLTEICVGLTTRKLQIYTITNDKLIQTREIQLNIPSAPVSLSLSQLSCCIATDKFYYMYNFNGGQLTQLFQHNRSSNFAPGIVRMNNSSQEYLLLGPDGLGIFADISGSSNRPPIQWSSSVRALSLFRGCIIAVDNEFVTVHELSSQQQIQSIHLPNSSIHLCSNDTSVLLVLKFGSSKDIYQLTSNSWIRQAIQCLQLCRFDDAVYMASQYLLNSTNNDVKFNKKASEILSIVAFHKFKMEKFHEAKHLFELAKTDIREIMNCYDDILPSSYLFQPKITTRESDFILSKFENFDKKMDVRFKQFLLEFLKEHRDSKFTRNLSQLIETGLVKLLVELEPDEFYLNLTMMLSEVDYDDLQRYLFERGHYHACALLKKWSGQQDAAVKLWGQLTTGQLTDKQWPGWDFVRQILINVSDPIIIVNNFHWIMEHDEGNFAEELVLQIIDRNCASHHTIVSSGGEMRHSVELLSVDNCNAQIIKLTENYPQLQFQVLMKLARVNLLDDAEQHDKLASLFIDLLVKYSNDIVKFQDISNEFLEFLCLSNGYQPSNLLDQLQQRVQQIHSMIVAEAFIRGRLAQHKQSLILLVDNKQFDWASRYCDVFVQSSYQQQQNQSIHDNSLFIDLLKMYLNKSSDNSGNESEMYHQAAFELLKTRSNQFNIREVMSVVSSDCRLEHIRVYLTNALARTCSERSWTLMSRTLHQMNSKENPFQNTRQTSSLRPTRINSPHQYRCACCHMSLDGSSNFVRVMNPSSLSQHPQLYHKYCYNSS